MKAQWIIELVVENPKFFFTIGTFIVSLFAGNIGQYFTNANQEEQLKATHDAVEIYAEMAYKATPDVKSKPLAREPKHIIYDDSNLVKRVEYLERRDKRFHP